MLLRAQLPDPAVGRGKKPFPFHWVFMLLRQLSMCQGSKAGMEDFPRKNNTGRAEGADVHYLYWQKLKDSPAPAPHLEKHTYN